MSACTHPELVDMPPTSLYTHDIVCSSCEKILSLSLFHMGCIADIVGSAFGPVWEKEAARWCRCEKHRKLEMMHERNATYTAATRQEPITVESLEDIWKNQKIVPIIWKPTGQVVYVTPQVADFIDNRKRADQ